MKGGTTKRKLFVHVVTLVDGELLGAPAVKLRTVYFPQDGKPYVRDHRGQHAVAVKGQKALLVKNVSTVGAKTLDDVLGASRR